jgi:glycine/D-amino acid oxidase-like deaminating enzyme
MTRSIWLDETADAPKEKVRHQVDVAIIGGGIIGAACAHFAAKRSLKTMIIEAGTLGSGASGRNGGFILRGIQSYYNLAVKRHGRDVAREVYAFTEENQKLLREFLDAAGVPFDACGSYLLACSLEELDELAQSAELMSQDGFEVGYLKKDPLDRDYYGALCNNGDLAVDPVKLVRALVTKSGANLIEGQSVTRVESNGGKLKVHASTCVVECERALLAVNAYAPLFDPTFTEKIVPTRGQILVTKPLHERILDRLCYANYGWEYFRQLPDNRLLLGGCRQHFLEEELGYADMVSRPVQNALESYLKDRFPEVAGVRIDYRFSGVMGFTKDGLPLVGEMKRTPGLFFALGCNGHGFSYGMNLAKLLVNVAFDGAKAGTFDAERAPRLLAAAEKGP